MRRKRSISRTTRCCIRTGCFVSWAGCAPPSRPITLRRACALQAVPASRGRDAGLPEVLRPVSLAPPPALPATESNTQLLESAVRQIAGKRDVVIVDADVPASCTDLARVRALEPEARASVTSTTKVLAQARTLVGGFGDTTILASFCGTPAVAYHSER